MESATRGATTTGRVQSLACRHQADRESLTDARTSRDRYPLTSFAHLATLSRNCHRAVVTRGFIMSQESGQDKTMENKEVGVKRRLRILQDVNRFSQIVDALKRPANAHVAQPLKKHRTSITQDAMFSSDSRALRTSCTDHNPTLSGNSGLAVAEEKRGKTLPVSVEEEDTECLVIDVSTRQISEATDTNRHIKGTFCIFRSEKRHDN